MSYPIQHTMMGRVICYLIMIAVLVLVTIVAVRSVYNKFSQKQHRETQIVQEFYGGR